MGLLPQGKEGQGNAPKTRIYGRDFHNGLTLSQYVSYIDGPEMPKVSVSVKSGKLDLLGCFAPTDNPKGVLKQASIPTGLDDTAAN